ncbi:MAG: alcohol dehydrogenase catalytic domain-containing protein [Nitrospirota bacterium]
MLANIIIKPSRIELHEIKTPTPSPGEIVVKIKAALTCGTDLKAFSRGHPMIPMPGVFGHEFSGIVTAVGKGVKIFKEGDEIMAVHSAPCLECRYCKKRLYNLCEKLMNIKVLGAFAEYILLPSHIVKQNVFYKPRNLTFEEAAFLEPLSCVVHGIKSLEIRKGDHVLVIGAGPIGLLHLLLLKNKGAIVSVTDINNKRLKMAKNLGADFILKSNPPSSPFSKGGQGGILRKNKLSGFIGFDYVFECTGRPEVWKISVNYVRKGGTVILFGGCKLGTTVTYDTGRLHYDEITLRGVFHFTPADVKKAYKLLCGGKLGVSRLISGSYPLSQIQKAFDKLSKGEGIKYAIIP